MKISNNQWLKLWQIFFQTLSNRKRAACKAIGYILQCICWTSKQYYRWPMYGFCQCEIRGFEGSKNVHKTLWVFFCSIFEIKWTSGSYSFSRFRKSKLNRLYFSASKFGRIPQQEANIDEEGNRFRSDFNTFLTKLVSGLSDRRDQEEMNIMNTKNWIMFQSKWFNIFLLSTK